MVLELCSHLNSTGDVVVVAFVVWTHTRVGEVVSWEVECGHWDTVEVLLAWLGEGQRPTEISWEKLDWVGEMRDSRWKQAVSGAFNLNTRVSEWPVFTTDYRRHAPHLPALPLEGVCVVLALPGLYPAQAPDVALPGVHLQPAVSPRGPIPLQGKVSDMWKRDFCTR